MARLTLRIDFDALRAVGPGKIRLLEEIDRTGSISAAGRVMGMSYRRAWLLVESLNQCFRQAVVETQIGGSRGGGAALTEFGKGVIGHFRAIEASAEQAAAPHIEALSQSLAAEPSAKRP